MVKNKSIILVIGATGFVGRALVRRLVTEGQSGNLVIAVRRTGVEWLEGVRTVQVGELNPATEWTALLRGVDIVINCAARVPLINGKNIDSLDEFRTVNLHGTVALAQQAAVAGVRRFIYISTIKVNGEFTEYGHPFTADGLTSPQDPYAISKFEAEQSLRQIGAETGMELVVIRPPLVYGNGVKGNFASLIRLVLKGVPLPFAAVTDNCRSLVALDNLIDLICTCMRHPAAANQTFLVSDGDGLSTAELLKQLGIAIGKPIRLFYIPTKLLKIAFVGVKKRGVYQRLCMSLEINIEKNKELLGWTPPVSISEALCKTIEGFRE